MKEKTWRIGAPIRNYLLRLLSLPHVSALRSHDQAAAGDAAGKDTAFGHQCSMSPSRSEEHTDGHTSVSVCVCVCMSMISSPTAAIPHTSPSGLDPRPNKQHSHCVWVHTHTHTPVCTDTGPCVCNWNKTECGQRLWLGGSGDMP